MSFLHDIAPALVGLFRAVLQASWQGALAVGLVLIVRRMLGTRVPARWHHLLWFLVLVRLLVPTAALPHSPASLENLPTVTPAFARSHPAEEARTVVVVAADPAPPVEAAVVSRVAVRINPQQGYKSNVIQPAGSWWTWAAWTWLGGAGLSVGWIACCVVGLWRRLRAETCPATDEVSDIWQACCRRWLGRAAPRLLAADWVDSPALVGWWRPTLLIPRGALDAFSAQDWEHVFAHEIAHLRWHDHWTQLLVLAAGCVHWFNPAVWLALRRLRADRELAADEWVLRHLADDRALAYGETLLKTLANRPVHAAFQPGAVGISEDGAQMKQRLRQIVAFLPRRRVLGSLAGLLALVLLATVVLGQGVSAPTAKPPTKPAATDAPATVAATPPPLTEQGLRDDLLAAARGADAKKVVALLDSNDPKVRVQSDRLAPALCEELLRRGEAAAFANLYDAVQGRHYGENDWQPSDALLLALVKEGQTAALDALLARGLALKRLGEAARSADAPTAGWVERRSAEVAKARADIDALQRASADGDLDGIRRLLDAGVDVNAVNPSGNTPLIRAVFKNRVEAAQLLLERGALVDKPRVPGVDYTPLCLVNSVPMAELLKGHGANVHAKLYGRDVSILTYVVHHAGPEVVAWFLRQGLDPRQIKDDDRNLLFGLEDARNAGLLLEAGVDPNAVDASGNPPLCYARSGAVVRALIEHGARVTGFQRPLLPNMVSYGLATADALTAALQAGADHDPATLQEALNRAERRGEKDYPDREKVRQMFLAAGARPTTPAEKVRPSRSYKTRVTAADGTLLGEDSTLVHIEQTLGPGGRINGTAKVESDGTAAVWIDTDASAAALAATSDGFATAYAGPFEPPADEKLRGVSFTLGRGLQVAFETVDEAGQPIVGARLAAYYPGPPRLELGQAVTNAAGCAVFEHVGTAPLTVQASADGFAADTLTATHLSPSQPQRWVLRQVPSVSGTVSDTSTGEPVAEARVKLAGARGPHDETHADPAAAPVLATSDAQGRFALTSLRPDSVYDLFVEAPGHGGVVLNGVKGGQAEMRVSLGPELTVRGRAIHVPAGELNDGKLTLHYHQFFKIGGGMHAVGKTWQVAAAGGEAAFVSPPLYREAVNIQTRDQGVTLPAKDLPKSDVVLDLALPRPTPAPTAGATPTAAPTPTPVPSPKPPAVASARVVNARGELVAGASIQPYTEGRGNMMRYGAADHKKTHTEQDGRFSYSVPGWDKVGVMVVARGYARLLALVPYDNPSPDIVLGPGVAVTGRLLKDGQPVPGVEVGIAQVDHRSAQFLDEIVAKTDEDGRFALPDVAPQGKYEVHAKRDSLGARGVTAAQPVTTGEPGTTVAVGDLEVRAGVVVTGRIMLPDGSLSTVDEFTTTSDGRRLRNAAAASVQLHVGREGVYDYQFFNLGPDLRFAIPALPGEQLELSAWVPGHKLRGGKYGEMIVRVAADLKPVEMVYEPESAEAKERALHPVFAPPPTPTPTPPPTAEQLAADAEAAREWADKLAAQPRRTEAEWREQVGKVAVGMTREEVAVLLPQRTVSIDYLQRDEFDEDDVHTSFYALDGEFAVALTFDFKGDEAWNAAGQPKPRRKEHENRLTKPPVLMRHDKQPNAHNKIQLEKARKT